MRHRVLGNMHTGLGNSSPVLLDNKGYIQKSKVLKKMCDEAIELFFKKWGGLDWKVMENGIMLGIEPAYQYEHLKIVFIAKDKERSYIRDGVAWGSWGSEIASKTKYLCDYKNKCKFVNFIDRWHQVLFKEQNAKN